MHLNDCMNLYGSFLLWFCPDLEEYFESKSSLLAGHRSQLAEIETEVDEEAREELENLRDEMAAKVKGQITNVRQKVHVDLQNKGEEGLLIIAFHDYLVSNCRRMKMRRRLVHVVSLCKDRYIVKTLVKICVF